MHPSLHLYYETCQDTFPLFIIKMHLQDFRNLFLELTATQTGNMSVGILNLMELNIECCIQNLPLGVLSE